MNEWINATAWRSDDGWLVRKGGDFVLYGITPAAGSFNFTATMRKGRRLQWLVDFHDARNYALFQLDKDRFAAINVVNGVRLERANVPRRWDERDSYGLRLDVTPTRIATRLHDGRRWTDLDTWVQTGGSFTDGRFGFLIPGSDEVGLANFQFTGK